MPGIKWDFFGFHFSYIAGIILFDVSYAVINIISGALGEHLDGAVREVADKTGKLMAISHPVSGKAKTDALNPADEDDVSGNHFLMDYSSFLSNDRLTNNNNDMLIDAISSHKRTILSSCSNK